MNQTRPLFIINKYRSILLAAVIMEAVSYVVSLTDTVVAGNIIGQQALAAIGLVSPFMTISTFLASVINSGTVINYSYYIGTFDKRRAHEFFSQGVILALLTGGLIAQISFFLRETFVDYLDVSQQTAGYVNDYFTIIIAFIFWNH